MLFTSARSDAPETDTIISVTAWSHVLSTEINKKWTDPFNFKMTPPPHTHTKTTTKQHKNGNWQIFENPDPVPFFSEMSVQSIRFKRCDIP